MAGYCVMVAWAHACCGGPARVGAAQWYTWHSRLIRCHSESLTFWLWRAAGLWRARELIARPSARRRWPRCCRIRLCAIFLFFATIFAGHLRATQDSCCSVEANDVSAGCTAIIAANPSSMAFARMYAPLFASSCSRQHAPRGRSCLPPWPR